ncbi:MAG: hypothetical protein WD207_08855, partial [Xanthobacteraceae bacterium]
MTADPSSVKLHAAGVPLEPTKTPTGTQSIVVLATRRFLFGALTVAMLVTLAWWLLTILAAD